MSRELVRILYDEGLNMEKEIKALRQFLAQTIEGFNKKNVFDAKDLHVVIDLVDQIRQCVELDHMMNRGKPDARPKS